MNGVNERDKNNDPLKASHYFMQAAALTDDPAFSENAQLAGDILVRGAHLESIFEHKGPIRGAVFSQDERRILTWSNDGTARVWDVSTTPALSDVEGLNIGSGTGQALTPPLQHQDEVNGAVFSQDERRILTRSGNTARVWDSRTGQALTPPLQHQDEVNGAVFSRDERRILTWSVDGTARVWDSATGQALTVLQHEDSVWGAMFSQDEGRILTWSGSSSISGTARMWDSGAGQALPLPLQHEGAVTGAVFSQDEGRILTWSVDGTARVWDSDSGQALTPLPLQHQSQVFGAVFSQDESRILTWSYDNTARVWDLQADYDFPRKHLILQVEVQTGTRLSDVGDIEFLSSKAWQEKKHQYEEIAGNHLKTGTYLRADLFLNALMNRPESCECPGEWMQEVNPKVVTEAAAKYAGICLNWGNFYLNRKTYDQAMPAFETVLQLRTDYPSIDRDRHLAEAYERLARALIESDQDVEQGIEYVQKSLELHPYQQPGLALHTLALGYRQQGQTIEAADAYLNLAREYTRWQEYTSALDAYQQAITLQPEIEENIASSEYAEVHYGLATYYLGQEKYEEAVREYEHAIKYGYNDADINAHWSHELARILLDQDIDIDKGVTYAQKSLEFDPDQDPEHAMDALALGYIKQGRHAEAVQLLEQALEQFPDNKILLERMQQAKEGLVE